MVINRVKDIVVLVNLAILFFCSSIAYPYNTKEGGHIGITRYSLELKVKLHGGDKLAQELGAYGGDIINGNVNEDTIPLWLRHFYNPKTGKGLWDRYTPAPEMGKMWYKVAKNDYCKGFKSVAWNDLGHVLHLIRDMTVLAHSHNK